jgi:hypothetical protein
VAEVITRATSAAKELTVAASQSPPIIIAPVRLRETREQGVDIEALWDLDGHR